MARNVKVILTDDVDGGEADETVTFALDGQAYEIDLAREKAAALRGQLGEWVQFARKVSKAASVGRSRAGSRGAAGSGPDPAAVRAWAASAGVEVPARGRLSAAVIEQYRVATGS